jgi:hypothetical protein
MTSISNSLAARRAGSWVSVTRLSESAKKSSYSRREHVNPKAMAICTSTCKWINIASVSSPVNKPGMANLGIDSTRLEAPRRTKAVRDINEARMNLWTVGSDLPKIEQT